MTLIVEWVSADPPREFSARHVATKANGSKARHHAVERLHDSGKGLKRADTSFKTPDSVSRETDKGRDVCLRPARRFP
jgi:hypothetical protein